MDATPLFTTIPGDIVTDIFERLPAESIVVLTNTSKFNPSADAIWNAKLDALGYPRVVCPQGFYFLVTSQQRVENILAGALNNGVHAHVLAVLKKHRMSTASILSPGVVENVYQLSAEGRKMYAQELAKYSSKTIANLTLSPVILDVYLEVLQSKGVNLQDKFDDIDLSVAAWNNIIPVAAKYRIVITTGEKVINALIDRILIEMPYSFPDTLATDLFPHTADWNAPGTKPFNDRIMTVWKRLTELFKEDFKTYWAAYLFAAVSTSQLDVIEDLFTQHGAAIINSIEDDQQQLISPLEYLSEEDYNPLKVVLMKEAIAGGVAVKYVRELMESPNEDYSIFDQPESVLPPADQEDVLSWLRENSTRSSNYVEAVELDAPKVAVEKEVSKAERVAGILLASKYHLGIPRELLEELV